LEEEDPRKSERLGGVVFLSFKFRFLFQDSKTGFCSKSCIFENP